MKQVWKYPIVVDDRFTLTMPAEASVLYVENQGRSPQMWCLVDPHKKKVDRTFVIAGTGHPLPDDPGKYAGTFQMYGGSIVFHLFEVNE